LILLLLAILLTACAQVASGAPHPPEAPAAVAREQAVPAESATPTPQTPDLSGALAASAAGLATEPTPTAPPATPTPTPIPAPPAGRSQRMLMPDTAYETPLYIIHSGLPGPTVMVIGGAHGDEPAGWTAARQVVNYKPLRGSLLIVPNANRIADGLGVRTTVPLGDLNRLYPGDPEGRLPMERMAYAINSVVGEFDAKVFIDMHESWGMFSERPCSSTAFLGQTVLLSSRNPDAQAYGQAVVDRANTYVQSPRDTLYFRNGIGPGADSVPPCAAPGTVRTSGEQGSPSGSLSTVYPGLYAFLVETSTQLPLSRRVGMHLAVFESVMAMEKMLPDQ
jgi:hypothetical protein